MSKIPLRDAFVTPDQKRQYVRGLFATIADRYDLITQLLSYGQDRRWKRTLVTLADVRPGTRVLDLACGTGDITYDVAARGADTTGLDVTLRMLELARAKRGGRPVHFLAGDMMALPFAAAQFDVVTSGYGIRNVPTIQPALQEIHRVLRPGGLFLSLDFNRPSNALVRSVYLGYLTIVGSALGLALHSDPDTYRYIPESIRRYPGATGVCDLARTVGFSKCDHIALLVGRVAIHRAVK